MLCCGCWRRCQAKLDAQEEANDKLQTRVRQLQEELKSTELRRNESVRKATSQMQVRAPGLGGATGVRHQALLTTSFPSVSCAGQAGRGGGQAPTAGGTGGTGGGAEVDGTDGAS